MPCYAMHSKEGPLSRGLNSQILSPCWLSPCFPSSSPLPIFCITRVSDSRTDFAVQYHSISLRRLPVLLFLTPPTPCSSSEKKTQSTQYLVHSAGSISKLSSSRLDSTRQTDFANPIPPEYILFCSLLTYGPRKNRQLSSISRSALAKSQPMILES